MELKMYHFLVVIEKASNNYSAYSPDLLVYSYWLNQSRSDKDIYEAIEMHVQGLLDDNLPIPGSKSFAEYIAIAEKVIE